MDKIKFQQKLKYKLHNTLKESLVAQGIMEDSDEFFVNEEPPKDYTEAKVKTAADLAKDLESAGGKNVDNDAGIVYAEFEDPASLLKYVNSLEYDCVDNILINKAELYTCIYTNEACGDAPEPKAEAKSETADDDDFFMKNEEMACDTKEESACDPAAKMETKTEDDDDEAEDEAPSDEAPSDTKSLSKERIAKFREQIKSHMKGD